MASSRRDLISSSCEAVLTTLSAGDEVNGCFLSRQLKECILKHFLHSHAGRLALEAGIVCSFVGNGDPDISHGMVLREK